MKIITKANTVHCKRAAFS